MLPPRTAFRVMVVSVLESRLIKDALVPINTLAP